MQEQANNQSWQEPVQPEGEIIQGTAMDLEDGELKGKKGLDD